MIVVWLFLEMPWVCLQFVIVVFPDHTYLLFLKRLLCSQILTIEANVCLSSKLPIFGVNGKMERAEMHFLHNSTTLLSLFMNKNDVAHLINQNLNLQVLFLKMNFG